MKTIGVLIFDDFELLDVFGPLEMFGLLQEDFRIVMIGEHSGAIRSKAGPASQVDAVFADKTKIDILLVPGGFGTRKEVGNPTLIKWLQSTAPSCTLVLSVCTGSLLLAKAGILDGVRATTNKAAYKWVTAQREQVVWQPKARWVEDGRFFTSSGVSAGIDMSLAVIAKLLGEKKAQDTADFAEYEWHKDAQWDPFAAHYGLVDHD